MNPEPGPEKAKSGKKPKDKNARCIYCRKCYNSGLCMMPWPGLPVTESKAVFRTGNKKR
jgi:hypothetical protein